jgi:condensation enzyme
VCEEGDASSGRDALRLLSWVDKVCPSQLDSMKFVAVGGYRLPFEVNPCTLRKALLDLVIQHEALRNSVEQLAAPVAVPLRVLGLQPADLEVSTIPQPLLEAMAERDYPADARPLLWAYLGYCDTRSVVVLVAHHTVADPWSIELLFRDLFVAYRARATGLAPVWRQQSTRPPGPDTVTARDRALTYWKKIFQEIPNIAGRTSEPNLTPAMFGEVSLPVRIANGQLVTAAKDLRTTTFGVQLAAYLLALRDLTGTSTLVVPVLTHGRARKYWDTVGLFMNAVVVRVDLSGIELPEHAVARVHREFFSAYAHELPLIELFEAVPEASKLFTDIPVAQFEVIQLPESTESNHIQLRKPAGTTLGGPILPITGLLCWLEADVDGWFATIRYRRELYDQVRAQQLGERFVDVLTALTNRRKED